MTTVLLAAFLLQPPPTAAAAAGDADADAEAEAGSAADTPAAADDRFQARKIVLSGIGRGGRTKGDLKEKTGFAKAVSIEYTLFLLDGDDRRTLFDPQQEQLRLGQRFQIRVRANSDVYVYVFHEDAAGERSVLLPQRAGAVALVPRDRAVTLPGPDQQFEVVAPVGEETLILFAYPTPRGELVPEPAYDGIDAQLKAEQDAAFAAADVEQKVTARDMDAAAAELKKGAASARFRSRGAKIVLDEGAVKTVLAGTPDAEGEPAVLERIRLRSR